MASVTVLGTPISTNTSRVLTCLLEKDVDFRLSHVDLSKGEHKSPDFLRFQPFGQVPAFRDELTTLFESRAICRYVCDKYPERGNRWLLGREKWGLVGRAWVEQWLEADSQEFNPPSAALIFQLAFAPTMGVEQDQALIARSEEQLAKVLDVYEQRLGESRFLAGDEFSLADLSHIPNCHYLVHATGKGHLIEERKHVGRWWQEISGRESWKKVVEMRKARQPAA